MSLRTSGLLGGMRRTVPALLLLVFAVIAVALLRRAGFSLIEARGAKDWGTFAVGLAAVLVFTRLVDFALFEVGYRLRRDAAAPELLRQLVGILVFGLLLGVLCKVVLSFSLPALLTTSAIITAVLGLALQETLGNLFSGIALAIERTVQVGDMIRTGETIGLVEELSWRAVRVRTMDGTAVFLPNAAASRDRLEVFRRGRAPLARVLHLGLEYDAPPAHARSVIESAVRDVPGVAAAPPPVCYLHAFRDFSVEYQLRYWLDDYARYLEVDGRVRERVWYRLEREGMAFAYPLIRHHQYTFGSPAPSPVEEPVADAIDQSELFSPLSSEERNRLAGGTRLLRFAEGETIVREGDTTSSMYLIASGRVSVSIETHGTGPAAPRTLATLGPGSAFGEISLLTGEPRLATVRASSAVTLVEIDKATLAPILESNPSLVEKIGAIVLARRREAADRRAAPEAGAASEPDSLGARIARFFGLKGA